MGVTATGTKVTIRRTKITIYKIPENFNSTDMLHLPGIDLVCNELASTSRPLSFGCSQMVPEPWSMGVSPEITEFWPPSNKHERSDASRTKVTMKRTLIPFDTSP